MIEEVPGVTATDAAAGAAPPASLKALFARLGKEALIYGVGGAIGRFLGFLLLPLYVRILSPADYGVVDVIATATTFIGIVGGAGMETAIGYYFFKYDSLEERRRTVTSAAAYLLLINSVIAVAVLITAPQLCTLVFGKASYAIYLRLAISALPFGSLLTVGLNLLRLSREPWRFVRITTSQLLFTLLLNLILVAIVRVGVIGVFITNASASVLFSLVSLWVTRDCFRPVVDLHRLRLLLTMGLPLIIGAFADWGISYSDRYFLLHYTTLSAVGVYSVGLRFGSILSLITWAFRLANAPFQFEIASSAHARQVYSRTLTYYMLVAVFCSLGISVGARPLLAIMATASYARAYQVVALACFSAAAYGVYQILGVGLLLTRRTGFFSIATAAGVVLNVGLLYVLVPRFGIIGAAAASLLAHLGALTLIGYKAQQLYPIPYEFGRIARILATGSALIGLDIVRPPGGLLTNVAWGAVFVTVFLALVPVLSLVGPSEQAAARRLASGGARRLLRLIGWSLSPS